MTNNTAVVIATAGDILLKVGTGGDERKLLVSGDILRGCSFYFKALTGNSFREVQFSRSSQIPQTIILQEDDAQAMEDLCMLLHGQEPTNFRSALAKDASADTVVKSVNRLLYLAVAVDKYDCVSRLRLQSSGLLLEYLEALARKPEPGIWLAQLATASYLFDSKYGFRITTGRITKELLEFHKDDYWPKAVPKTMMPERVTDAIAAKRDRAAVIFATQLRSLLFSICPMACSDCREEVEEAYSMQFEPGLAIPYRTSLVRSLEVAQEIADELRSNQNDALEGYEVQEREEVLEKLKDIFSEVERTTDGLCLRCVRAGDSLRGKCSNDGH